MNIIDPFSKAYLTDEERKYPLWHQVDYCEFKSCVDLSIGVEIHISSKTINREINDIASRSHAIELIELIAKETASFTAWWAINYHHRLNGFSGMGSIRYKIITL